MHVKPAGMWNESPRRTAVRLGGSSLLTSMLAIGLLNNIGRARAFSVAPKLFE